MIFRNVEAFMFQAGGGTKPFPGVGASGADRIYPSPGVHSNRTYSCHKNGHANWVLGRGTGTPDITKLNPVAPVTYFDKHFILRSLKVWGYRPGYFYIRTKEAGSTWENSQPQLAFRVEPGVTLDLYCGPNGVDLGDRTYFDWVGDATNGRVYASIVYDIA